MFETSWKLGKKVPDLEAVEALQAMGFTTVVAHRSPRTRPVVFDEEKLDDAAAEPGEALRSVHSTDAMSACEIVPRVGEPGYR